MIESIIGFLVGGGLIKLLEYFSARKKDNRSYDIEELEKYKIDKIDLEKRVFQLEISSLISSVPEWRKEIDGIYTYINPAYEKTILMPLGIHKTNVIGKKDEEVFAEHKEFRNALQSLDKEVRTSPYLYAIKYNVKLPSTNSTFFIIKEVAASFSDKLYIIGRAYKT